MKEKSTNKSYYINEKDKKGSRSKVKIIKKIDNNENSFNIKKFRKNKVKTKTNRKDLDSLSLIKKFILLKKDDKHKIISNKLKKNSWSNLKKRKQYKNIITGTFEKCININKVIYNRKEENYTNLINKINFISFKNNNNKSFNNKIKKSIKKIVIQKNIKNKIFPKLNKNQDNIKNKPTKIKKNKKIKKNFKVNKPKYFYNLKKINYLEFKKVFLENIDYLNMKDNSLFSDYSIKKIDLKLNTCKFNLILDLDETLIHSYDFKKEDIKHDFEINFSCSINDSIEGYEVIYINKRPYLKEFIKFASKYYNIIIFTASDKEYADKILNVLDPNNEYFTRRLYRHHCIKTEEENYIKNLNIIKNIDLEKTFIVDNHSFSFLLNLKNGIIIFPYYDNLQDRELKELKKYLKYLRLFHNPVEINYQYFNYYNWEKGMINLI